MRKILNSELGRLSVEEVKHQSKIPVHIVLDNLRSAHNVGSFFRTADGFGIQELHLCGITAQPPHPEIEKTALGSTESVDWQYHETTLDCVLYLKKKGIKCIGIEQIEGAEELQNFKWDSKQAIALVFGSEVGGISNSILGELDSAIIIPQVGSKHSLNVAVCGGVFMWHVFQMALRTAF